MDAIRVYKNGNAVEMREQVTGMGFDESLIMKVDLDKFDILIIKINDTLAFTLRKKVI